MVPIYTYIRYVIDYRGCKLSRNKADGTCKEGPGESGE